MHIEQFFMLEVFAGGAVLCSVAKQAGLHGSIAVDKARKKGARSTIYQLDLTIHADRCLLEEWLSSPLCVWLHVAPVCGTASRARETRRGPCDPQPLRSHDFPLGLPWLQGTDRERVRIANCLFEYSCELFDKACKLGVFVTMENPRGSYFWITPYVLQLILKWPVACCDFQACMLGGERDKWTRIVANFGSIRQLDITCDHSHPHRPWGKASVHEQKKVWAASVESQYPRKLCVALVHVLLKCLHDQGMTLQGTSLADILRHPLMAAQQARIAAGDQPRGQRVPHVVPDFASVGVFKATSLSQIPCSLLQKLSEPLFLTTLAGQPCQVPAHSRFLRFGPLPGPLRGGGPLGQQGESSTKTRKLGDTSDEIEVAFGLPWTYEAFIEKACASGHPRASAFRVPSDLEAALDKHLEWNDKQIAKFRHDRCKQWLVRAKELEAAERADRAARDLHVQEATVGKRLLLTEEILRDIGYEDVEAVQLMRNGATLAGAVGDIPVFQRVFKPGLCTLKQLENEASRKKSVILGMTKSSGDPFLDKQLLEETKTEVSRGWAEGPFELSSLEQGATISRRFPLSQRDKVRMIDDFSVSGVNDSCSSSVKVDLHLVDTFCAVVRSYFSRCLGKHVDSSLVAKTFDLKSAYRQVPIKTSHLKFGYFSIFNCERNCAEIYRLRTLPFGATHSVYCFLRLARMLHAIAVRGLYLLTTNFYDDYILASKPSLSVSAENSMQLIFLLTGWIFAKEGNKASVFSSVCKALGVQFDLSRSSEQLAFVANTDRRVEDLCSLIDSCLQTSSLGKAEALSLRGKLGFADSFLHGRLGALTLKLLSEHAHGTCRDVSDELKLALKVMRQRLRAGLPKEVSAAPVTTWYIYTDASYEQSTRTGGLGGVLVNQDGGCVGWFGVALDASVCSLFGALVKETIIYELELAAAVLSLAHWRSVISPGLQVWFGDNDSVRYALLRGAAVGRWASLLMKHYLELEMSANFQLWFARVPTECNISDFPSRFSNHQILTRECDESEAVLISFRKLLESFR